MAGPAVVVQHFRLSERRAQGAFGMEFAGKTDGVTGVLVNCGLGLSGSAPRLLPATLLNAMNAGATEATESPMHRSFCLVVVREMRVTVTPRVRHQAESYASPNT